MALDEDMVAAARMILAPEEVIEADLVQAGRTLVRRDVAADLKTLAVGLTDHDRRVPPMKARIRRSTCSSPGNHGSDSGGIVLM